MTAILKTRIKRFTGPLIQSNYLYQTLKGSAYLKGGDPFDITKRQTKTGIQFTPRYYQVTVTEFLEDLEVEMAGERAAFSTLKTDLAEAALTLSGILEIAFYHHGQNLGAGNNRIAEVNGLEEFYADGTTTTWSGVSAFPTYGQQTRADVNSALNTRAGLIGMNAGPTCNFRALEHTHLSTWIGRERAKFGITTTRCLGFIAENFLPHQKIDVIDPEINWPGFKFNNATIVAGNYVPGQDGIDHAVLGDCLTNSTIGETFWWVNPGPPNPEEAYFLLAIAQSAKFAFGWTGFKGARADNQYSGQVLVALNLIGRAPRFGRQLYGFTR
ncbi:MAG: hypothetical protein KKE65_09710 [Actinobacteria bacterium]|nr:hypothetical protein [Actinomycetota bacterium]